jgi:Uma2 family endonuclease
VDGVLEERNVGGTRHGLIQMEVGFWFRAHPEWNLRAVGEQRTKVSSTRVRVPDAGIVADDDLLLEEPRTTPPFIAIEILSPEDRMARVIVRLRDFVAMGVPNIWLIDPMERVAWTYSAEGLNLVEGNILNVPDSPVFLDLNELFKSIEKRSSR